MTSKRKQGKNNNTKSLMLMLGIAILVILFLLTKSADTDKDTTQSTTTLKQASTTARQGDVVEVEYTGKYQNGTVFDTSIEDTAKGVGLYSPLREYKPIIFTIGLNEVVLGLEEALVGMKVSEEKTITIPPEKGYGNWDADNVKEIPRMQNTSQTEEVEISLFEQAIGREAVEGETVELEGMLWPIEVLKIENERAYIRHYPENGTIVPTQFGNSTLTVINDRIYARLDVKPGDRLFTEVGYVTIAQVTETTVTLDLNHDLAGQTIIFDIKLVSINQKEDPYASQINTQI